MRSAPSSAEIVSEPASALITSLLAVPVSDSLEVVPVMLAIVVTPRLPTERVCVRTMPIVKDDHHPPLSDRVLTQQRQQLPGRTGRFYSRTSGISKRRRGKLGPRGALGASRDVPVTLLPQA